CTSHWILSPLCQSVHSAFANDRQWEIDCKPSDISSCFWSGYFNLYDQEMSYNCPANHVIVGFYSDYQSYHGGRRWNVLCCTTTKLITFDCRETPMVNYWTEDFDWYVPGDNFLTGIYTHNKDNNGDHRWSFSYCRGTTQDTQTVNSQILAANKPVESYLTEGDVAVKKTRSATVCSQCKWPKSSQMVEVPYVVNSDFTSAERSAIDNAINAFHLSTCIRFVPLKVQTNYISIVKATGCWSYVGQTGGAQQLSLGSGCIQHGVIQHELIHTLGFWHEQSRSDRNIYVRINYENIDDAYKSNFDQRDTNNLNVPYDYSSVMHYGPKDFSKNTKDTITPLDPSAQIGQRKHMSENDILKINKLYGCKDYLHKNGNWDNVLGDDLSRQCPYGQAVSGITSVHNNDQNDRLWGISCKAFKETRTCRWSNYVNNYWGDLDFKCGDNQVIAGVYGEHSSLFQDRRWKFYCCSAFNFATLECKKTPVINYWKEYFSWPVPSSNFLTGVKSIFDKTTRDRRWSFSYCQGKTQ
uniref:zinc metalloproteinase nas-36-like n=1 Tax=Scatophagus argus TaxID=75038 RepID=UPI001ED8273C